MLIWVYTKLLISMGGGAPTEFGYLHIDAPHRNKSDDLMTHNKFCCQMFTKARTPPPPPNAGNPPIGMRPQWTYIPAGSGVRQNTYPLGLGYHSQSGMRTDKSPFPYGWDPGGNIYPVSRGLLPFAVSSEKQ